MFVSNTNTTPINSFVVLITEDRARQINEELSSRYVDSVAVEALSKAGYKETESHVWQFVTPDTEYLPIILHIRERIAIDDGRITGPNGQQSLRLTEEAIVFIADNAGHMQGLDLNKVKIIPRAKLDDSPVTGPGRDVTGRGWSPENSQEVF